MQAFAKHRGSWTGPNDFRLMPTDEPHTAPATLELSAAAGGNLTLVAYTWSHPADGPQDGFLTIGQGESADQAVALWADSWHQQPAPTTLAGDLTADTVALSYTYAGDWQWIITLDATAPDTLTLRMDNVVPSSAGNPATTYWAMQATLRRLE